MCRAFFASPAAGCTGPHKRERFRALFSLFPGKMVSARSYFKMVFYDPQIHSGIRAPGGVRPDGISIQGQPEFLLVDGGGARRAASIPARNQAGISPSTRQSASMGLLL